MSIVMDDCAKAAGVLSLFPFSSLLNEVWIIVWVVLRLNLVAPAVLGVCPVSKALALKPEFTGACRRRVKPQTNSVNPGK